MQTSMKAAHFNLSKWSHEDAMKSHSLCDPDICTILMSKHFFVLDPGLNYLPKFGKKKKKRRRRNIKEGTPSSSIRSFL